MAIVVVSLLDDEALKLILYTSSRWRQRCNGWSLRRQSAQLYFLSNFFTSLKARLDRFDRYESSVVVESLSGCRVEVESESGRRAPCLPAAGRAEEVMVTQSPDVSLVSLTSLASCTTWLRSLLYQFSALLESKLRV